MDFKDWTGRQGAGVGLLVSAALFLAGLEAGSPVLVGLAVFVALAGVIVLVEDWRVKRRQARAALSTARLTLRPDRGAPVYLVVENTGCAAAFWATLRVFGMMRDFPGREVFARWDHTDAVRSSIPPGRSRRFRLARLERDQFSGTWHVPYTTDSGVAEAGAYSTWEHGESYEDTAEHSILELVLTLYAEPDLRDGSMVCQVRLRGASVTIF